MAWKTISSIIALALFMPFVFAADIKIDGALDSGTYGPAQTMRIDLVVQNLVDRDVGAELKYSLRRQGEDGWELIEELAGCAQNISINAGQEAAYVCEYTLPSSLLPGEHKIYVRAKILGGTWSSETLFFAVVGGGGDGQEGTPEESDGTGGEGAANESEQGQDASADGTEQSGQNEEETASEIPQDTQNEDSQQPEVVPVGTTPQEAGKSETEPSENTQGENAAESGEPSADSEDGAKESRSKATTYVSLVAPKEKNPENTSAKSAATQNKTAPEEKPGTPKDDSGGQENASAPIVKRHVSEITGAVASAGDGRPDYGPLILLAAVVPLGAAFVYRAFLSKRKESWYRR